MGIGAICLLAFGTILWFTATIQEFLPHSEDEVAYVFQAQTFAQNRVTIPTPPLADAFWSPFVLDYAGQRFGKYPPGWPLLLSLGVRWGAPWLVNALVATLTLALLAHLGFNLYPASHPLVPLLATGLALSTPGFLFLSSSLLSHAASLFWTMLSLVALYHLTANDRPRTADRRGRTITWHALLLGLCLGAVFITRPFAALGIGLPIGIFLLVLSVHGDLPWPVLIWVAAGGVPVVLLLPLYWWLITGDPTFNPYLLVWPYDRVGFGADVGPLGYTLYDALFINTRLKLTVLASGLFGWPGWTNLLFLPLPFIGLLLDRRSRASRWDWLLLGLIAGLIVVHIFYWAFGGADGGYPRYYYEALPAFLLLTARGIFLAAHWLNRWPSTLMSWQIGVRHLQLNWVLAGFLASLVIYNFGWTLPPLLEVQRGKYGITPAPLEVVTQADLPRPALVLVQNVKSWSDFAAPFVANSPNLDGPIVYAIDWGPAWSQRLRDQFPERSCWQLTAQQLFPCDE